MKVFIEPGKRIAIVPNIDVDTRTLKVADLDFRRAVKARELAVRDAQNFMEELNLIQSGGTGRCAILGAGNCDVGANAVSNQTGLEFDQLSMTFTDINGATITIRGPFMPLLPGECATSDSGSQFCNMQPMGGADDNGPPVGQNLSSPEVLLKNFPVKSNYKSQTNNNSPLF